MTIKFRGKQLKKSSDIVDSIQEDIYIPPQSSEEDLEEIYEELDPRFKELLALNELLKEEGNKDVPEVSVLEALEARHKVLYVSKVSQESKQYYIFTSIKRKDFKMLQEQGVFDNEEKGNEVLVEKCLLYPAPTTAWRLTCDAGIVTTLGKQIAYKSGFVSTQEALSLIKII